MGLQEQILVLIRLTADPDQQVCTEADKTIRSISDDQLLPLLNDTECPKEVLAFFCFALGRSRQVLEAAATNNSTPDDTVADLALVADAPLLQILLFNQVRLIRYPVILDNILQNQQADTTIRRRTLEIHQEFFEKTRSGLGQPASGLPLDSQPPTTASGSSLQPSPSPPPSFSEGTTSDQGQEPLEVVEALDPQKIGLSDPQEIGVYKRIAMLNTSQKIKQALLGSREERAILIRDTNRMVANMVLKSPKISEQEVSVISTMRNVSEEILRLVAENRSWVKNYTIVTNLVKNSKTPMATALHLLPRLMEKDIRFIAKDRSVAEVVRRSAQRMMVAKGAAH